MSTDPKLSEINSEYLGADASAKYLGFKRQYFFRLVKSNQFNAIDVHGWKLFAKSELDEWRRNRPRRMESAQ